VTLSNLFSLLNPRRLPLPRPGFFSPLATNCANIGQNDEDEI